MRTSHPEVCAHLTPRYAHISRQDMRISHPHLCAYLTSREAHPPTPRISIYLTLNAFQIFAFFAPFPHANAAPHLCASHAPPNFRNSLRPPPHTHYSLIRARQNSRPHEPRTILIKKPARNVPLYTGIYIFATESQRTGYLKRQKV